MLWQPTAQHSCQIISRSLAAAICHPLDRPGPADLHSSGILPNGVARSRVDHSLTHQMNSLDKVRCEDLSPSRLAFLQTICAASRGRMRWLPGLVRIARLRLPSTAQDGRLACSASCVCLPGVRRRGARIRSTNRCGTAPGRRTCTPRATWTPPTRASSLTPRSSLK